MPMELHPTFKSRLYDIASNIQNNNTEYAHYLAELTVRDYGTHYLTSMDAGAVLSQTDFIRTTDTTDKTQQVKLRPVLTSLAKCLLVLLSSMLRPVTIQKSISAAVPIPRLLQLGVCHSSPT